MLFYRIGFIINHTFQFLDSHNLPFNLSLIPLAFGDMIRARQYGAFSNFESLGEIGIKNLSRVRHTNRPSFKELKNTRIRSFSGIGLNPPIPNRPNSFSSEISFILFVRLKTSIVRQTSPFRPALARFFINSARCPPSDHPKLSHYRKIYFLSQITRSWITRLLNFLLNFTPFGFCESKTNLDGFCFSHWEFWPTNGPADIHNLCGQ